MAELSILSEAIIELALDISYILMTRKFGDLKDDSFSIIGLGKLGAGELNYSSDIDIITLYISTREAFLPVFSVRLVSG